MKTYFWIFFLLASQQIFAQEEYIRSFHSDLKIDRSGVLTVTETIEIFAAGNQIRRGIVRSLPLSGTDYRHKKVKTTYRVIGVEMDGSSAPYQTKRQQGNLDIYIGDQNKLLEPGWYTFMITYSAEGQLGYFEDYDEVYWNVNGFGWEFRIEKITASIQLPTGENFDELTCYTGYFGSSDKNCNSELLQDGRAFFSAENISKFQNLTVSAGFPKGVVPSPPPPGFWEKFGYLLVVLLGSSLLLAYYFLTWKRFGMDPPKPVVIPEFDPPSGLSPAAVGMIHRGFFHSKLIATSLVNLAVNGLIRIEEKKTKGIMGWFSTTYFELFKLNEPDAELPEEEKNMLQRLFPSDSTSLKIEGKYSSSMAAMYSNYRNTLNSAHKPMLNQGLNWKFWIPPVLFFLALMLISIFFDFSGFPYNPESKAPILFLLIVLTFFLMIFVFLIFRKRPFFFFSISMFFLFYFIYLGNSMYQDGNVTLNSLLLASFIQFFIISYPIYVYLIRRPSEEKLALKAKIEGFKRYLSTAEERQIQMFNPPDLTPEVFEKLLPYAMAFGVEKIWGKKFENFLKKSSVLNQKGHQPLWYRGAKGYAYHRIGTHLGSSLSRSIMQSSTQSSSSGGGSGSRGGGFSGGGRGGGGGRGW